MADGGQIMSDNRGKKRMVWVFSYYLEVGGVVVLVQWC